MNTSEEAVEKMIGERYTIECLAGNGGFGDVYKGHDNRMSREVAIKVVRSLGDKEAEVLSGIEHKGLPKLYDVIRGDEITVMVMEWIPGVDLEKYISNKGTLSEKTVVKMGTELLDILDYLHSHSPAIIYQDLKPSNIMLMPDGHIKLVDFGTAIVMDYGDADTILAGTVGYGAPEQRGMTGVRHASVQSDLYAWGGVMYTMLSGIMLNKPPYTMKKIRTVCPGLSYGLTHVIGKCTKRNEKDRFQDVKSVLRALNYRNLINVLCKGIFTALFASCVIPFIFIWYRMYAGADFTFMERKINTIKWLMYTGDKLQGENLRRTLTYVLHSELLLKNIGYMILTGAWMFMGLRLLQSRKYLKVKRSIFLSHRKYPGLWIPTLMAGVILGCGIGSTSTISDAKEIESEESILPLSFADSAGNRMLLRFDSSYDISDDMRIIIDTSTLGEYENGCLKITVESPEGEKSASRMIPLTKKEE